MTAPEEDITYYYRPPEDPFRSPEESWIFAKTLREVFEKYDKPLERWPVRNREPRESFAPVKRALICQRDGDRCRVCGTFGQLVLDHIVPRSAFRVEDLRFADRSDNLRALCWNCNEERSNFDTEDNKRLGVAVRCWECVNPAPGDEAEADDAWGEMKAANSRIICYCGQCGVGAHVPDLTWIL